MQNTDAHTVRWGILGCGDVTEVKSGPALQKTARSQLVAVMRRDAQKAADYARRHNVARATDDADALINDPDINAIYIATPPSSHAGYAIRALQAGKNVLVEKPIALNANECDAIEDAIRETGGKLCVAYYRRALPRFEKLKELIADGTIGPLRLIEVRQFRRADQQSAQHWKTDPSIGGGGSFVDMQTHTLDWLTYVFGSPAAATGLRKNQANLHAAEDLVQFMLDFKEFPAMGLCAYAAAADEEAVIFHGAKGRAEMGFFRPSAIDLQIEGAHSQIDLPDPPHVHQPFIARVVAHFLDDAPNPCSAAAGRQSTELVETIFAGLRSA
ncbi:Gfo/Idh/MocA family oxidoreductase [Yoonia sp. BS5-3]|uniref:Gfo/Idh/MocA family protein n=1 Tax=Yoonia phaeophyticola TaxID=3137369 RepID=A0ABZ2V7V6_9RHOB